VRQIKLIDHEDFEETHERLHQGIKRIVTHQGGIEKSVLETYRSYLKDSESIIAFLDDLETKARARNMLFDPEEENYIKWSDSFSVGNTIMDDEHKSLILVINKLHSAILNKQDNQSLAEIVGELITYTENHFSHEEELLEKSDYPKLKGHKGSHGAFCDKIEKYRIALLQNERLDMIELLGFLKNWLIGHILKEDMQYRDYLGEK
jgi:hemerythrin